MANVQFPLSLCCLSLSKKVGLSPLMIAAQRECFQLAKVLVEHKANVNLTLKEIEMVSGLSIKKMILKLFVKM